MWSVLHVCHSLFSVYMRWIKQQHVHRRPDTLPLCRERCFRCLTPLVHTREVFFARSFGKGSLLRNEPQYPPPFFFLKTDHAAHGRQHATPRYRPLNKVRALEQPPAPRKRPEASTPRSTRSLSTCSMPLLSVLSLSLSSLSLFSITSSYSSLPPFPPPADSPRAPPPHLSHTSKSHASQHHHSAPRPIRLPHPPSHHRPADPAVHRVMACPL